MLHPLHTDIPAPEQFTYPFQYEPHPLCRLAAHELQQHLQTMTLTEGKMFGVLVVSTPDIATSPDDSLADPYFFLAAYSGLLEGRNDWPYFVPPVFDAQQPDGHFKQEEARISAMRDDSQRDERRQRSQQLQQWLFRQYRMLNAHGQQHDLIEVWHDYHTAPRLRQHFPLPPGGTGDCCAPKLLQYAYSHHLRPLCMAEFWWGPSPKSMIRHHGQFYPACSGKCKPVLSWMLQGLNVDPTPKQSSPTLDSSSLTVIYDDEDIAVVDKPSGMLSVPGKTEHFSVATIAQERWPGALLAHRLDQSTSGLIVIAKNRDAYRHLQQQFSNHTVRKRYVAKLSHPLPADKPGSGTISLPLYSDPMNRPWQVVDYRLGKPAVTDYEVFTPTTVSSSSVGLQGKNSQLSIVNSQYPHIALYPHTGRTHQLRVHCAHPDGLGCPILGDELYGQPADRLYLHAEQLWLIHPTTLEPIHFQSPVPFN